MSNGKDIRKAQKAIKAGKPVIDPYKQDVLYTDMGQLMYPGQVTKIPSNQITMEGVNYPVKGIDDTGYSQMMYPGMNYTFPGQYVTEYPQMQTAQYGGWLDEYGDGAEKRKIPQSGIVVDKRTNIGYAMGDDGKTRTFNVLTGQVVDVNKDYSYDQVAKNPKLRGTPVGYYLLQKELTKIKGDDDDKHYKNKIRYLKPISAFGEKVNSSSDLAFHRLYSDNAYNPNDKEFNRRKALLNQSDANKRCASWGCTNVDDYTYDNVNKMFSKQDTLLVIDSKRPKDLALLNQTKKRMKASLDQDPSLAVGYKKMGGWLDDYQVGAETLEDNDDILPSWDKVKATLNPMNWGVTDYTKSGTRAQAFNAARKAGEKEFMWNNERFNTDYAGTPEQQLKETGITNERLQNRSLLQKRFFNNVYPRGYESDEYGNPDIIKTIKRVGNAVILNKKDPRMASLDIKDNPRVDASRMYTGLPQQNNTFNISKYKPTNSKDNIFYYSINNKKFENDLIDNIDQISTLSDYKKYFTKDEIKILKEGKDQGAINKLRKKLLDADDYNLHNNYITQNLNKTFGLNIRNDLDVMGNFKVDKGTDDRGNYISYFDKWDLAPLEEKKQLLGIKAKYENKANTDYFGKPFEIYDRIYIKDYGKGNTKMYYSDKELSALDSNKKDFDTQALQTELSNRGYKFPTSTKKDGRFDGIYGDETKKALQDYQSKNVKSKLKYGGWLDDLDTYQTAGQVNNRQDNTRVVIPNLPKDVFNEKNSFKKDWLSDAYEEDENVKLLKKQLAKDYQKNGLSKDQAKILAEDAYRNVKHNKSLKETIPESTFEQHVPQDLTSKTLEVLANPLLAMKQYKGHRLPDHFSSADEDFMSPVNISNLGYQFLTRPGQLAFSSELGNEAIDNIKEGEYLQAGLNAAFAIPGVKVIKDAIKYKNKLKKVANIKEIRKVSNYLNKEGALENQGINELDQQYANRLELENDIPPPPTYEQYAEAQIDPLSRQDYILRNLQRIDPDPFNAMNSIGLREPNYELYNDLYDQSYSSAPVNRLPDIWTNYRKRQSLTQDLINRSGVTKEQALERFNLKDKDLLSKMSAKDFKETVVKPTGDLAEYIPGPSVKQMTYKSELGDMQLKDAILMSKEEYSTAFNDRLDLLNNIIKKNNKTGIDYIVKGLDPNGVLKFETPKQVIKKQIKNNNKHEVIKRLKEHNKSLFDEINNIKKNPDPTILNHSESISYWNKQTIDKNNKLIAKFENEPEFKTYDADIPEEQTTWSVRINPGKWSGAVEDIANTEYYKSIPGLDMRNTSSIFGYGTPKRGSGTYESINEYLKALDLGRVKAGFNSQTDNSFGLWNNAVKKGNAFGFYRTPDLVHGVMKSALPYIGTGALGAAALDQVSESSDIPQDRLGGQRRLKKATSKNIQSSINDLMLRSDLMQRNQTLFGPAGKRRYKPGLKYKQGGWLDQFDK